MGVAVGATLALVAALLLFIAELGNLGAWMAAIARLPYVAGTDGFLPRAFTRLHPRWRTPYVALLLGASGIILLLIGSLAGQRAEEAYRMLISVGVILYFIPYLYMFASLIFLQNEPAAEHVVRVPGGRTGAYVAGTLGLLVTAVSIVLSFLPGTEIDNRLLFFGRIIGSVGLILGLGVIVFLVGKRRGARMDHYG
jgi:amino acid transporter